MRPLNEYVLYAHVEDLSNAAAALRDVRIPIPYGGEIVGILASVVGTTTGTDAITVTTQRGAFSATLDVDGTASVYRLTEAQCLLEANREVLADEWVTLVSDGAGASSGFATFAVIIRCRDANYDPRRILMSASLGDVGGGAGERLGFSVPSDCRVRKIWAASMTAPNVDTLVEAKPFVGAANVINLTGATLVASQTDVVSQEIIESHTLNEGFSCGVNMDGVANSGGIVSVVLELDPTANAPQMSNLFVPLKIYDINNVSSNRVPIPDDGEIVAIHGNYTKPADADLDTVFNDGSNFHTQTFPNTTERDVVQTDVLSPRRQVEDGDSILGTSDAAQSATNTHGIYLLEIAR